MEYDEKNEKNEKNSYRRAINISYILSYKMSTRILFVNLANSQRDSDSGNSLFSRLPTIVKFIKSVNPDVICFVEAGRPTRDHDGNLVSWVDMVSMLTNGTGLIQVCITRNNETDMAFGISIFARPGLRIDWTSHCLCSDGFKTIAISFSINHQTAIVTHLPVNPVQRMSALRELLRIMHDDKISFAFGDFNSFPDGNGPEMMSLIEQSGFIEFLNVPGSFIPFPFDRIPQHPALIHRIDGDDGKCIPLSHLDHVFGLPSSDIVANILHPISGKIMKDIVPMDLIREIMAAHAQDLTMAVSDHFPLLIEV